MSISQRLYLILGIMVLLISAELTALWFTIHTLSAVRAYVGGEGLWSKAEKDAVYQLEAYGRTHDPKNYQAYLDLLRVPLGDREARIQMAQPDPDRGREVQGFLQGRNDRSDIPGMIALFQRFNRVSYISDAIADWTVADGLMSKLQGIGAQLHEEVVHRRSASAIDGTLAQVGMVNNQLTVIEDRFSYTLGEGSRWLTDLVLKILLGAALTVELSGLVLTASVTTGISRRLKAILRVTDSISQGDYAVSLPASSDEIGKVSTALERMARDVDREQSRAEHAVRTAQAALKEAQRVAHIGSWEWDVQTGAVSFSKELLRLCGVRAEDVAPTYDGLLALIDPQDRGALDAAIRASRDSGDPFSLDCRLARSSGQERWVCAQGSIEKDGAGRFARVVGSTLDITDRKHSEERLEFLAQHDPLTGLPNRSLLIDRLHQAIGLAERNASSGALLFLDLDHFKNLNDTLGHAAGDRLLVAVGQRIQASIRHVDTVARSGGDEFLVVLTSLDSAETAKVVARGVLGALARPFNVDGHELYVTASMGISVFPADSVHVETLIRDADTAMYQAKREGRNKFQFYSAHMHDEAVKVLALHNELRRALENHQFELHYQPMIDLATGEIVGAEALLRWRHPTDGLRLPGEFIEAAEDTGLVVPLGEWVLREACNQLQRWRASGFEKLRLAVNVSSVQLGQPDFAAVAADAMRMADVDPFALELEITETAVMADAERSAQVLRELRALGVGILLDDFGTGYSSLNYLKRFPIDAVKIDRSFVRDIVSNTFDRAIAESIVSLCHKVGLRITAEGVETRAQLELLRGLGCDEVQGFCFSAAVEPAAFEELLRCWERPAAVAVPMRRAERGGRTR